MCCDFVPPEKFDLEAEQQLLIQISRHIYDMKEIGQSIIILQKLTKEEWKDDKAYEFCVYMENIIELLGKTYGSMETYYDDLLNHLNRLTR